VYWVCVVTAHLIRDIISVYWVCVVTAHLNANAFATIAG
jgi:hypothetical protein